MRLAPFDQAGFLKFGWYVPQLMENKTDGVKQLPMPLRMFAGLCALGIINLAAFLTSYWKAGHAPGGGVEGLGAALFAYGCVFFSVLLSGFGLNQLYSEIRNRAVGARTIAALMVTASPLLFLLVVQVVSSKVRTQQTGL